LWWSDESTRLNINSFMHSGGRNQRMVQRANIHSMENALRVRTNAWTR
jgi:hypothetical protein